MLTLYKPRLEDLWFRQTMLQDPETMSYNASWGGTIPFPPEVWESWYSRWVDCQDGTRLYRYLLETDRQEYVGEVACHLEPETGRSMADVVVYAGHRGKGYGREGLELLCQAVKERGCAVLWDSIAADNPAVTMFLKMGFAVESDSAGILLLRKEL